MAGKTTINVSLKRHDEALNVSAKLLVGADGGNSSVRKLLEIAQHTSDYGHNCTSHHDKINPTPTHNTAFERFTALGRWLCYR